MKNIEFLAELVIGVHQRTDRLRYSGDIGIELEVEGSNLSGQSNYWNIVPENSLRDGCEYVLAQPCKIKDLPVVIEDFCTATKAAKFVHSLRTSTHIHINVIRMTFAQYYSILGHYYLFEDLLVGLHGSARQGNLFCLRASDAFGCIQTVVNGIREHTLPPGNNDTLKYAAANLVTASRYGSLEFRFLRGANSGKFIEFWARNLYEMVQKFSNLKLDDTVRNFDYSNLPEMLSLFLPKDLAELILKEYDILKISRSIESAMKRVHVVNSAMNEEHFRKASIYLKGEDLDENNLITRELKFKASETVKVREVKLKRPTPFPSAPNMSWLDETPDILFDDPFDLNANP